jgi:hypothetical protein
MNLFGGDVLSGRGDHGVVAHRECGEYKSRAFSRSQGTSSSIRYARFCWVLCLIAEFIGQKN